jgi:Shedu protein SduA, C-terminal
MLDTAQLTKELDDLEALLKKKRHLRERKHVLPFFRTRKHLCTALGLMNGAIGLPDRIATELDLFGDFACDAATGDSERNAYTLVEFEDATEYSVFKKLQPGKTVKRWSSRFEHGFSQLVDWAWRLTEEGNGSAAYRRIFGKNNATIQLLLVVGRDSELTEDDLARVEWRANSVSLGAFRMTCMTFDGVLSTLRRRLFLAERKPLPVKGRGPSASRSRRRPARWPRQLRRRALGQKTR